MVKNDKNKKKNNSIIKIESCPLCSHPGKNLLSKFYFEHEKSLEESKDFFNKKFKKTFDNKIWEIHFKEHIEPFCNLESITKDVTIEDVKKRAMLSKRKAKVSSLSVVKQMLFDLMVDAYVSKPMGLKTKEQKHNFSSVVRDLTSLARTYKEYQQMEITMLASGKTEEEQKKVMKNYMMGMINNAIDLFSDDPKAQERIAEAFGISNLKRRNSVVDFDVD